MHATRVKMGDKTQGGYRERHVEGDPFLFGTRWGATENRNAAIPELPPVVFGPQSFFLCVLQLFDHLPGLRGGLVSRRPGERIAERGINSRCGFCKFSFHGSRLACR